MRLRHSTPQHRAALELFAPSATSNNVVLAVQSYTADAGFSSRENCSGFCYQAKGYQRFSLAIPSLGIVASVSPSKSVSVIGQANCGSHVVMTSTSLGDC